MRTGVLAQGEIECDSVEEERMRGREGGGRREPKEDGRRRRRTEGRRR